MNRINRLLMQAFGDRAQGIVQNPLRVDNRSEPVPDVMLVNPRPDFYSARHPTPSDVLLLVEVSDTTLTYDRRVKLPLYTRNGIPEVWIADLKGGLLRVHRGPTPTGYQVALTLRRGDRVALAAFPDVELAIDDILG